MYRRRARSPGKCALGARARAAGGGNRTGDADMAKTPTPKSVEDFKAGKTAALNFLKGQVMRISKGKANPGVVGELLERKLRA